MSRRQSLIPVAPLRRTSASYALASDAGPSSPGFGGFGRDSSSGSGDAVGPGSSTINDDGNSSSERRNGRSVSPERVPIGVMPGQASSRIPRAAVGPRTSAGGAHERRPLAAPSLSSLEPRLVS